MLRRNSAKSHVKVNNHDPEAQDATFTLTNVAPQFSRFNELAWREYECLGLVSPFKLNDYKLMIYRHSPQCLVHIWSDR